MPYEIGRNQKQRREIRLEKRTMSNSSCFGIMIAILLLLPTSVVLGENIDPDNNGFQYAWAENVGWMNAEPLGDSGPGIEVANFDVIGWLWGENIGWISLTCQNTGSCATVDYGIVNDGAGNLSGHAYGENIGWLSFSCQNSSSCETASYGVTVDPATGNFEGHAYGENVGWVSFSCDNTSTCGTVTYRVRTDWCAAVTAAPAGTPQLFVTPSADDVQLFWPALTDADWYEVAQGDLSVLSNNGGDFTTGTDQCVADNETGTSALFSGTPAPGDGFWFLVGGVNCKGKGTYDSGAASQVGLRDMEIAASGNSCS